MASNNLLPNTPTSRTVESADTLNTNRARPRSTSRSLARESINHGQHRVVLLDDPAVATAPVQVTGTLSFVDVSRELNPRAAIVHSPAANSAMSDRRRNTGDERAFHNVLTAAFDPALEPANLSTRRPGRAARNVCAAPRGWPPSRLSQSASSRQLDRDGEVECGCDLLQGRQRGSRVPPAPQLHQHDDDPLHD